MRPGFACCAAALVAASPLGAQPDASAILRGLRVNTDRAIDFHAARYPDTVYVGQQVTYQVAVLLGEAARARLRRNPEFVPPELRGMLAYELGRPVRRGATADGVSYEAYVFQRALFPVVAGELPIPAPSLSYTLPQSTGFFSREERASVRAESLAVVVRPLPAEGRPAAFTGAVGFLRAVARLDTAALRVGDPVVLTMRVEGTGNIRLLARPRVEVPWASVVPGSERLALDTSGALVRGSKEFDWILTPVVAGGDTLPALRYAYFDPARAQYAEATTDPLPVRVAGTGAGARAEEDDAVAPLAPLRAWRPDDGTPWSVRVEKARPWWLALGWGGPLTAAAALVLGAARRRRGRRPPAMPARDAGLGAPDGSADRSAADRRAPDRSAPADAARARRRRLLDQVAGRLGVPSETLAAPEAFARALRRHGVSRETTALAVLLRDALEVEGFGPPGVPVDGRLAAEVGSPTGADDAVREVVARIDAEAVPLGDTGGRVGRPWRAGRPRAGRGAAGLLMALVVAGLSSVGAERLMRSASAHGDLAQVAPDPGASVPALVAEATQAYQGRQFVRAAALLEQAAHARPDDVTLLVNWGTAAWAAADTVGAVVAWQRAARFQPWAGDVQANLARLPAGARIGAAAVPLVPVAAAWLGAAALWVLGWALAAWSWWSGEPGGRGARGAWWVLAVALALGGWALWGRARLAGGALSVARRPETLRSAPAPDAASMGGVATGDVVARELEREGWARVRHADGRQGWLPLARLRPLLPEDGRE